MGVQNEYSFALVSATAHLEHYRRVELPAAMQVGAAQTPPSPPWGPARSFSPVLLRGGAVGRVPPVRGQGWLPRGGQGCSLGGMQAVQGGGFPTRFPPGAGW